MKVAPLPACEWAEVLTEQLQLHTGLDHDGLRTAVLGASVSIPETSSTGL